MTKTSERRGFYRAMSLALDALDDQHAFVECDDCKGEGGYGSTPCAACEGYGSKGAAILRGLKPEGDNGRLKAIATNCQENFAPEDRKSAWKLAVATQVLQDADSEAVVAWMFANLSVILQNDPSLSHSEICLKWSEIFSDVISEIADEDEDSDRPSFGKSPVGEA